MTQESADFRMTGLERDFILKVCGVRRTYVMLTVAELGMVGLLLVVDGSASFTHCSLLETFRKSSRRLAVLVLRAGFFSFVSSSAHSVTL